MKIKRFASAVLLFVLVIIGYSFSTHQEVLLFLFPGKIWVHRVNSLENLKEVTLKYAGVELDVVWEGTYFDVNHPPAPSTGLSLVEYLEVLPKNKTIGLWLDFKNLNVSNVETSLNHLDSLVRKNGLKKENIIIESRHPVHLKNFKEKGFKTSYYLPSGVRGKDGRKLIKQIKREHGNNNTSFMSTHLGEYVHLKYHFPDKKMIIWYLGSTKTFKNKWRMYKAILDDKIKIILLPYKPGSKVHS